LEALVDGVGATRGFALIGCIDVNDVGIKGRGVIDGRGAALQAAGGGAPSAKPFLLLCSRSTAVAIEGIRLANSSAWTLHISQCSDVTVSSVAIHSVGLANNDGIDIDSSPRVRVENCTIESGDDAICLKTTSNTPCTDIVIKDCTMATRCAAFKIGTESAGDFSAIHVSDCHVIEANLGAVKILSVDGANISNVLVERLRVESADTPIFLRLGTRGRVFRQGASVRPPGTLTNVTIRDVEVNEARRIGILVAGVPGYPIERVSFERINITMVGETATQVPREPVEAPASYPKVRMFGTTLPAYGIYGRHVRALEMKQIQIQGTPGDARPRLFFSNDSSLLLERQAPLR
jgi:polygalacturonase